MERKDFIEQVGASAASILIFGCLGACSKSDTTTSNSSSPSNSSNNTATKVDFTINITLAPYNALNIAGGYYIENTTKIIVARTLSNEFIAASSLCTHQQVTIEFQSNNNRFYCSGHGSTFSVSGTVTNGPANTPLKQYKTALSGNMLRIYE